LAKGYGMQSFKAQDRGQLEDALHQALALHAPVLIEVSTLAPQS
jgi:thiamine pyrophosphate-dependent acetolactate synthase large subunit-like protein